MKKCLLTCLAVLFFMGVFPLSALAQDDAPGGLGLSLGEILNLDVTAVGFFAMDTEKAPGFVQNFLMEDLESSSVRTLGDLVDNQVVGMTYGMNEAMGALIGSRGVLISNNAKTLVMLDSQQLHARSHGYSDWFMTPFLGDIRSVEVVNGPGAIVHGSGAINGFFNLIPKNGSDDPGFSARAEYGEYEESALLDMGYGMSYGDGKDLYLYGGFTDADGEDIRVGYEGQELDREGWAYGYRRSNFRLASYWRHGNFSLNTFYTEINPSTNTPWKERRHFHHAMLGIRPKYTWHLNENNFLDIMISSELHDVGFEVAGSKESHIEAKVIYKTLSLENHQIALGGLWGQREFRGKSQYFSNDYESAYPIYEGEWTELGIFAEDLITWGRFAFSLGLRWDTQASSKHVIDSDSGRSFEVPEEGHFSPRVAASYELTDNSVIKASYQHGFRYPDANYYNSAEVMNNKVESLGLDGRLDPLVPETVDSYEIGFHQDIPKARLSFDMNLFYNTYKKQLTWSGLRGYLPDSTVDAMEWTGAVVNLKEDFESYGSEIIAYWMPLDNLRLRMGYALAKTRDLDTERYHTHQVKMNLKTSFLDDKLIFDLNTLWNSKLPDGESRHDAYGEDRLVFDLSARYAITDNISVKVAAKNLAEEETPTSGYSIDNPTRGHLGEKDRRVYVSLSVKM